MAVIAADSPDFLIAGAMKEMASSGCDTRLIIFDDFYLQCITYTDSTPGIYIYT
jgi:hypothetical protein